MKVSFLQVKRALNVALFVLLLSVAGTKNTFAQTQLATLQHGDSLSVFYGSNAFVEAHTAAVGGDIITLSSGSFTSCDITKGITLRGAGCEADTVANTAPTIFSSDITLDVADTVNFLNVEGISFVKSVKYKVLYNPMFTRCYMKEITHTTTSLYSVRNAQFINCFIKSINLSNVRSTIFINSVVNGYRPANTSDNSIAYNSILQIMVSTGSVSAFNSIIFYNQSSNIHNSSFINCIGIGSHPFNDAYTSGCVTYASCADVFKYFTGTFDYDASFVLDDEIVSGFHGTDGTQVGIYGGFMPYDIRPTYMVLKRCNVGSRTTIDGKLSVDIEVIAEEE